MAEKNNATCSICGCGYHVCLSCHDSMKLHPWKIHCCSASHFQVFQVVRGLSTGLYTKNEVKDKLKNINLEDIESFKPHIKQIIKDILKEEKFVINDVEKVEKVEEVIVEEPVQVEVITEKNMVIEKPVASRKRNYKVETE